MIIFTILLLAVMEVSLSFDNAVINASVLRKMPPVWQKRFLTWGIFVAVFGMRLVFPLALVSLASHDNLPVVLKLAIANPNEYGLRLASSQKIIDAFGGTFLLMIFLSFHCDRHKETHWLPGERHLKRFESYFPLLAAVIAGIIGVYTHSTILFAAAMIGVTANIILNAITDRMDAANTPSGLAGFLYLELIDASCSLDGVIAAFVLTNNIGIIAVGLGIGAFAMRSLTLYLVRGGILKQFIYLEHGAHYGIGALAIIMLTDIFYQVPEPVTGMIGVGFIGVSMFSSINIKQ